MENLKALRTFTLPFALYAGLVRIIIDYIPKKVLLDPEIYYMSFFVSFLLESGYIFYVMGQYKKVNPEMTRKDGIKLGVIIMLIVGIFFNIGDSYYTAFVDPDFKVNKMLSFIEQYSPEALPVIKQELASLPKASPSLWSMVSSLSLFALTGIIISFVSSLIVVRKSNERPT